MPLKHQSNVYKELIAGNTKQVSPNEELPSGSYLYESICFIYTERFIPEKNYAAILEYLLRFYIYYLNIKINELYMVSK